jgi:hypothetical protein
MSACFIHSSQPMLRDGAHPTSSPESEIIPRTVCGQRQKKVQELTSNPFSDERSLDHRAQVSPVTVGKVIECKNYSTNMHRQPTMIRARFRRRKIIVCISTGTGLRLGPTKVDAFLKASGGASTVNPNQAKWLPYISQGTKFMLATARAYRPESMQCWRPHERHSPI